jgi:hypothetical protein
VAWQPGDGGEEATAVALSESVVQSQREEKESRGWWRMVGFFPFYSGRGGGSGQRAIMVEKRPTVLAVMPLKVGVA